MQTRQRRPRGTAKDKVALHLQIDRDAYATIDGVAEALGISKGRALDLIAGLVEFDEQGRPTFWDGPLAGEMTEELPLASSA